MHPQSFVVESTGTLLLSHDNYKWRHNGIHTADSTRHTYTKIAAVSFKM